MNQFPTDLEPSSGVRLETLRPSHETESGSIRATSADLRSEDRRPCSRALDPWK